MSEAVNLSDTIQQLVSKTIKASKLSDISYGTVTSESPLEIMTDQKVPLYASQLSLTRQVTDYEIDVEVSTETEKTSGGSGDEAYSAHDHKIKGVKKIRIKNALKVGDRVVLIRLQGAQERVVLDRIAAIPTLEGEWL